VQIKEETELAKLTKKQLTLQKRLLEIEASIDAGYQLTPDDVSEIEHVGGS